MSLINAGVKSVVESAQRELIWSTSKDPVVATNWDVLNKGYCAATEGIGDFFFSLSESLVTEMIYRGALDEALNQSINC